MLMTGFLLRSVVTLKLIPDRVRGQPGDYCSRLLLAPLEASRDNWMEEEANVLRTF